MEQNVCENDGHETSNLNTISMRNEMVNRYVHNTQNNPGMFPSARPGSSPIEFRLLKPFVNEIKSGRYKNLMTRFKLHIKMKFFN